MNEHNKNINTKLLWLIVVLLLTIIILTTVFFIGLDREGAKCVLSTEGYLIHKYEEANNANIFCRCQTDNPKVSDKVFRSEGYQLNFDFSTP